MTIENGASEAANDTALTQDNAAADQAQAQDNTQVTDGQDTEADKGKKPETDDEEFEVDGEKYVISRKLREALVKPFQQDYSRKTEELATNRKTFEGEREAWNTSSKAQREHIQEAAKVMALNDRIAEVDDRLKQYANVDWQTLYQTNPDAFHQHQAMQNQLRLQRDEIRDKRDTAARAWTQKEQEYANKANGESRERIVKAQAEIAKLVEGWAPDNELDRKLSEYGIGLGLSREGLANLAIQEPKLVRELNRLRIYDEAAKKQKQQQTFEQSQQAKPVTRVGGNGGSAQRKTTDSSGDALSAEEWAKREQARIDAMRRPQQRRA